MISIADVVEWIGAAIISSVIGWATEPKWGIMLFGVYIGIVFISIAFQLQYKYR